jgi:hypothetical protein
LQRREAVRRLLEGHAEARRQRFHVVAQGARGGDEGGVGHQQRGGGVVQQADADQRRRLGAGGLVAAHGGVHRLARFQQHQLEGEAEAPPLARQRLGQPELARRGVEAAIGLGHGDHLHAHAVAVAQALGDGVVHLGRRGLHVGLHRLGGGFQLGEVVGALVEEVARFLRGQQQAAAEGSAMPLASSRATRQAR